MKRLLLVLAMICFKNGLYAIGKVDPNEQFLQDVINERYGRVIASLESKSVDIDTVNKHGQTALILAVRGEDQEMVKILLNYLPDINKKDFSNKTALDYAKELKNDDFDVVGLLKRYESKMARASILSASVVLSSIESLKPLEVIERRNLELKRAIKEKNIPMLDLLLDYYAKEHQLYLEEPERKPKNLLDLKEQKELDLELNKAIKDGDRAKIIDFVKKYRAEIVLDPEEQMKLRRALREAIYAGDITKTIKLIMDGADIDFILESNFNFTPILDAYIAEFRSGNFEIFQLLLDLGANLNIERSLDEFMEDRTLAGDDDAKRQDLAQDILDIHKKKQIKKQEAKKLLEQVKPIKIAEIKKALEIANWPTDVVNIVCEY